MLFVSSNHNQHSVKLLDTPPLAVKQLHMYYSTNYSHCLHGTCTSHYNNNCKFIYRYSVCQHLAFHSSFCHSLSNLSTFWMLCCHRFQAVQCSELLMQRSLGHNRRTLDPLLAKCYFYHSRAYELVDRLKEIRRYSRVKKLHNTGGIKQGFFVSICDPPCMGN